VLSFRVLVGSKESEESLETALDALGKHEVTVLSLHRRAWGAAVSFRPPNERETIMATKKNSKAKTAAAMTAEAIKPAKGGSAKAPPKRTKADTKTKKPSALDAAARVLAGTSQPMNSKELIEQMAAKGYWTSPGGQTPHATLHAAISREIKVKGADSRFVKAGPGKFARKDR
jgi:hypothetical protein